MSTLVALATLPLLEVWGEDVRARKLEGERITMAVVELAPGALVPEHHHHQEQLGICIQGSVRIGRVPSSNPICILALLRYWR